MATTLYGPVGLVEAGFFRESFVGLVPERFNLKGKNAEQQFTVLALSWDSSRDDNRIEPRLPTAFLKGCFRILKLIEPF